MTAPRVSLRGLMLAVVLVAANLAAVRGAIPLHPVLPVLCGPPLILLELAAWRAWRGGRPGRGFWVGYLMLGGLMTGVIATTLAWQRRFVPSAAVGWASRPAPPRFAFWVEPVMDALWWFDRQVQGWLGPDAIVGMLLVLSAPVAAQVAAGVAGGLIGRRIAGRRGVVALAGLPGEGPR
jgi:hypothetical protein